MVEVVQLFLNTAAALNFRVLWAVTGTVGKDAFHGWLYFDGLALVDFGEWGMSDEAPVSVSTMILMGTLDVHQGFFWICCWVLIQCVQVFIIAARTRLILRDLTNIWQLEVADGLVSVFVSCSGKQNDFSCYTFSMSSLWLGKVHLYGILSVSFGWWLTSTLSPGQNQVVNWSTVSPAFWTACRNRKTSYSNSSGRSIHPAL